VDNSDVCHSEGTVPDSITVMAATTVGFLVAINVPKFDVLGFSMGGTIA
jgi:pimeloyl-ACP methyl ester carboxylesterase